MTRWLHSVFQYGIATLIGSSLFFLSSCTTSFMKRARDVTPSSREDRERFERALKHHKQKEYPKSLSILDGLMKNDESDLYGEVLILRGKGQFELKNYKASAATFETLMDLDRSQRESLEAIYMGALSYYRLGEIDRSDSLLSNWKRFDEVSLLYQEKIYKLLFILKSRSGKKTEALRALVELSRLPLSERNMHEMRAIEFCQTQLQPDELQIVANESNFDKIRYYAKLKLGQLYYDQQKYNLAQDLLLSVSTHLPDTSAADQAQQLLKQINARNQINPLVVGAVLPLSGPYANIGYRSLRGLEIGLGLSGNGGSEFQLAIVDSEGHPDIARRGVKRLVVEDNAIAMVGSLLSKTAFAVSDEANALGIPSIGLSQRSGLTGIGPYVFRNALTSEMQVRELVRYSMEELKFKHFAIMYPNDAYGVEYANLFWNEVLRRGGTIEAAQPYKSGETDFQGQVQRLVGIFYVEDRLEEYKKRLSDWKEKQPRRRRLTPPEEILPPVVTFEALFIPDSPRTIGQIAPMLAYYDVKKVRLLGTNLWNSEDLIQRGDKFVENAIFVDSLLAHDPLFQQSSFFQEFERIYGEAPGIFEIQAYETALILRESILRGALTRLDLRERLTNLAEFSGVLGPLSMSLDREIRRPLVTLTVHQGAIVKSDQVHSPPNTKRR